MANINEEIKTVEVIEWDRANRIEITNNYKQLPILKFFIERGRLTGEEFSSKMTSILEVKYNGSETFPLYHPGTDEELGMDGSQEQLQVLLYSLFRSKVNK